MSIDHTLRLQRTELALLKAQARIRELETPPEVLPISSQHHHDLHAEIDVLRMALAEANRRLADTGVTISVDEVVAFYDIAVNEGGEQA